MTRKSKPEDADPVKSFQGRVVIVEVADTPEGSELALSASSDGAIVVLVGSNATKLGVLASKLLEVGGRCSVFVGDPTNRDDRAALTEMVNELFGPQS